MLSSAVPAGGSEDQEMCMADLGGCKHASGSGFSGQMNSLLLSQRVSFRASGLNLLLRSWKVGVFSSGTSSAHWPCQTMEKWSNQRSV